MSDKFYSVNQIAEMFELHPKTVRRYIKEGKLQARKVGGEWRVTEAELKALLDGDAEFKGELVDRSEHELQDFILGGGERVDGKVQVMTVVDIFVDSVDEAVTVSTAMMEAINNKPKEETPAKFRYFFEPDELKARFVLSGSPTYIRMMLEILDR